MLLKGIAMAAALATLASGGFCLCADESEGLSDHHGRSRSSSGESGDHEHSHHRHDGSEPSHPHGGTEDSCVAGGFDLFLDCQPLSLDHSEHGALSPAVECSASAGGRNCGTSPDEKLALIRTRRGTPPLYLTICKLSL